jgi:hypothetical protein
MIPDSIISELNKELEAAKSIDTGSILKKIREYGFNCILCAECCKNSCGDNTVAIFPFEVRAIMDLTGLKWLDVVLPPESDAVDENGYYHTFEWALRKKPDGDCLFLNECGKCSIYPVRPLICRTYPFVLDKKGLETCICKGLKNGEMSEEDALAMAQALKERYITELVETIKLFEHYKNGSSGSIIVNGKKYIVHDSEGRHKVAVHRDGSAEFI